MEKGDKQTNKAIEFLYKLSLNQKFQSDLVDVRKKRGIPDKGFNVKVDSPAEYYFNLTEEISGLRKKYNIPSSFSFAVEDYILFNEPHHSAVFGDPLPSVEICPPTHITTGIDEETLSKIRGDIYAKILIYAEDGKSDTLKYLEKNWSQVEDIFKSQGWKGRRRVRKITEKERNELIKNLWKKPKKELEDIVGRTSKYKEFLIQDILETRGFGAVSDGYIRKIGPS